MPSVDRSNKTERVHLRLTKEEREQLQFLAEKQHMTISEYVRWLIHKEAAKSA